MRAMLTTGTPRHLGTTGVAWTKLRGLGPLDASGGAAPHPFVHRVDGHLNGRTTPKFLFDHPWLRPVSDHYIDFINPVLRSLKAGLGERASGSYPSSRGRFVFSSGGYLAATGATASANLLRRTCRGQHQKTDGRYPRHPGNPAPSCLIYQPPEVRPARRRRRAGIFAASR